jgi:hypothetical protein
MRTIYPLSESKDTLLDRLGARLAARLQAQTSGYEPYTPSDQETLARTLRPGDVLLIEGNQRVSAAIKYLTQSTWSHAAFFAGDQMPLTLDQATLPVIERPQLIEVNIGEGCVAVPLKKYASFNTRICRPIALTPDDRTALVGFMISRLGMKYDLKNILDMLRYFMPTPPVPVRWRRRLLAFGSGDPTRAICSTLIAQAFEAARYPVLPTVEYAQAMGADDLREILHIRHHSLYMPRDFDISPYFSVVKPTLEAGFDYRALNWAKERLLAAE